jgi:hypothetical protein
MRDHAHTLSDFRTPTLSIECEPCGRRGRYNVARLIEKYGDMRLPELRHVLANCPKAKSFSVHDQCKVRYGEDSLALMICECSASLPRGARFADLAPKRN